MKLSKEEVLLYSLWQLKGERPAVSWKKEHLAEAMDITQRTLEVYLSRLVREGYIIREGKRHNRSVVDNVTFTDMAKGRIKEISSFIGTHHLHPDVHGMSDNLLLEDLLNMVSDPLERAYLLNICMMKKHYDVASLIMDISGVKNDLNVTNYLRRLDEDGEERSAPYDVDIFRMSLYGDRTVLEAQFSDKMSKAQMDAVLIYAETQYRQGKLDRAKSIYDHLLSDQPNLTRNQRFQANLGLAQVIRRKDGPMEAIEYLEGLSKATEDRLYQYMILQVKGTCYGIMGDHTNAIRQISLAIRSFRFHNHPLLLAIALNNRGVMFFSKGEIEPAHKDWKQAMLSAKKARSRYVEGRLMINIADVEIKRGRLKKALILLDRSERLFKAVNDLEGMSGLEFNRALFSIAEGDIDGFKDHFQRSESVAAPLPSNVERDNRRKVMLDRANESGNVEIAAFLKGLE